MNNFNKNLESWEAGLCRNCVAGDLKKLSNATDVQNWMKTIHDAWHSLGSPIVHFHSAEVCIIQYISRCSFLSISYILLCLHEFNRELKSCPTREQLLFCSVCPQNYRSASTTSGLVNKVWTPRMTKSTMLFFKILWVFWQAFSQELSCKSWSILVKDVVEQKWGETLALYRWYLFLLYVYMN